MDEDARIEVTKIRFAIVHGPKNDRSLVFPNWARYFYDSREDAEKALGLYLPDLQARMHFKNYGVSAVECYSHGEMIKSRGFIG